jgi:hypothetical protein
LLLHFLVYEEEKHYITWKKKVSVLGLMFIFFLVFLRICGGVPDLV